MPIQVVYCKCFTLITIFLDGSIPTAWGPLAIHPKVRANRRRLWGWAGLEKITKDFLFCILKRITPLHTVERFWLTNILSVDYFLQNCLYVCPLQHWGEIGRRSQRFLLSKGAENVYP